MTTRPRRPTKADPSLQLVLSPSTLLSSSDSPQIIFDAILPWMAGFEKRYHPQEHETDVVKCICNFSCPDEEESREMVQCDQCGNWQHIPCLRIPRENIPADYFCHLCLPGNHKHLFTPVDGSSTTTIRKSSKKTRPDPRSTTHQPKRARTVSRGRTTRGEMVYSDRPSSSVDLDHDLEVIREKKHDQVRTDTGSTNELVQSSHANEHISARSYIEKDDLNLETRACDSLLEHHTEQTDSVDHAANHTTTLNTVSNSEKVPIQKPINQINFPVSKVVSSAMDTKLK